MIFSEARVYGNYGAVEARLLKTGDNVWSWDGARWLNAKITRIKQGQTRQAIILHCFDGETPKRIRCDEWQVFKRRRNKKVTARHLEAGDTVLLTDGAHQFYGEIGTIERVQLDEPEPVFGFELTKPRTTLVAEGFLCRI